MANILVVGAGPTGLTAAVELTRLGHTVRIIEQKPARESISKAIGINARSLELLEAADITPRLLAEGLKVKTSHMHYGKHDLTLDLSKIPHRYNFMLALPQDKTETILESRLNELGVQVLRHATLTELIPQDNKVLARYTRDNNTWEMAADFVVGADGAHSLVRKLIKQPFFGRAYEEQWNLVDLRMDWPYSNTDAHAFIGTPGYVGVVIPMGDDRYRLVANHPNAMELLPQPHTIKQIIWQSDFAISCRLASSYQQDRIFLAGDAAHIHTPVGGRGMNLGIEDACALAQLIAADKWKNYSKIRRPAGKAVVEMTDKAYRLVAAKNPLKIFFRNHVLFPLMRLPFVQKKLLRDVSGLK